LEHQVGEESVSLDRVTVGDVLRYELPDDFLILPADSTVADVRSAFARALEEGHPRIYAVVVTETGKPTEEPLGIVTPWDVME
jgi:CBS domain